MLLVAVLATLVLGCAVDTGPTSPPAQGPLQLHERFNSTRYLTTSDTIAPPGFIVESLLPAGEARIASMSVEEALEHFLARGLPDRYAAMTARADEEDQLGDPTHEPAGSQLTPARVEAIKTYAAARHALLHGDLGQAERLLRAVLEQDPQAAPAWELLAEAMRLQGRAGAFLAACEQLLQVDANSMFALAHLGRRYTSLGQDEQASRLLAPAKRLSERLSHRIPTPLIDADLALSLHRLGFVRAAADLYEEMLSDLGAALQSHPYYRGELRALYEQQSSYLRLLGDAAMAYGDGERAIRAYDNSARLGELPGTFLLARQAWAQLVARRPAGAINLLIEELGQSPDLAPARHDVLLSRYIQQHTRLRRQFLSAMTALSARHPDSSRIALLRATAEPAARAGATVRDLFAAAHALPSWTEAALLVGEDLDARIVLAGDLAQLHPDQSSQIWKALERVTGRTPTLHEAVFRIEAAQRNEGVRILAAHALSDLGEQRAARRLFEKSTTQTQALSLGWARILAQQYRFPEALSLLDRLEVRSAKTHRVVRLRIEILSDMQWFREALAESDRLLSLGTPLSARDHLLRARLYAALRDPFAQAEEARKSIALDPDFDEAYEELIRLLDRTGPFADPESFTRTVQALHARNPNSDSLRLLRVEEQVRRQELADAAEALLLLARERPSESTVLDALVDIWATLRIFQAGLQALADLQQRSPHEPMLARAAARLHMHRGDAESALLGLEAFLAEHPQSIELQDLYESALHQAGRGEEAIERVIARLGVMQPLHRTPEMSFALALAHLGRGDISAAFATLAHLDDRVMLTEEQCGKARHILVNTIRRRQREAEEQQAWRISAMEAKVAYQLEQAALWHRAEIEEAALALGWIRLVTVLDVDDVEEALKLIELYHDQYRLSAMVGALAEALTDAPFDEVLFFFSNWPNLSDSSRVRMLERLLAVNPDHAMALNNLGYTLLEMDDDRLDEAVAYVERAYALEPTDHNIIDSLGWARYKQGVFEDEFSPDGSLLQRGAASLLTEALQQVPEFAEPVVADHLADSLWRLGRLDEARGHWERALERLPARDAADWQTELRRQIIEKLEAIEQGVEPPIAASPGLDQAASP